VLASGLVPRRGHAVIPAVTNSVVPTVEMASKLEYSFVWNPHYSWSYFTFYTFVCQRDLGQFSFWKVSVIFISSEYEYAVHSLGTGPDLLL
jgi:hypothetical protein